MKNLALLLAGTALLSACGTTYPDPREDLEALTARVAGYTDYTLGNYEPGIMLVTDEGTITANMWEDDSTLTILWEQYQGEEGKNHTAVYRKEDGDYIPYFVDVYVPGMIEIAHDLDGDGDLELIVKDYREFHFGYTGTAVLYRRNGQNQYVKQQTFAEWAFDQETKGNSMSFRVQEFENSTYVEVKESGFYPPTGEMDLITYHPMQYQGSQGMVEDPDGYLVVLGPDVWVRSEPTTGNVVMRLGNGDAALVLNVGPEETIRGRTDRWYLIAFEGQQGWIFGSETTLAQPLEVDFNIEADLRNLLIATNPTFEEPEGFDITYRTLPIREPYRMVVQECQKDTVYLINFFVYDQNHYLIDQTVLDYMGWVEGDCSGQPSGLYCLNNAGDGIYCEVVRSYVYDRPDGTPVVETYQDGLYLTIEEDGTLLVEYESEMSL